jgi:hypothetical protein
MSDEIRVNGNAHSWGSILLKIDGDVFSGFTSIEFGDKRTRTKGYGMGRHQAPSRRSRGKYEVDPVKLEGFKGSLILVRAALAAKGPDGITYGDTEFQIVVQYVEASDQPITVELDGCVYTATTSSDKEGADLLMETVELDCMKIYRNGLTLFDGSAGSP